MVSNDALKQMLLCPNDAPRPQVVIKLPCVMSDCCRRVPLALMLLNEQYHRNELNMFQWDFLEFFAYKGEQSTHQPPPSIEAFQRWFKLKCGYQVYNTLSGMDAFRFSHYDSVRRNSRAQHILDPTLMQYESGINEAAMQHGVNHFANAPTFSCGDGTRAQR